MKQKQNLNQFKQEEIKKPMSLTKLETFQKEKKPIYNGLSDYESFRDPHLKDYFFRKEESRKSLKRLQEVNISQLKNLREEKNSQNIKKRKSLIEFIKVIEMDVHSLKHPLFEQKFMKIFKIKESRAFSPSRKRDLISKQSKRKTKMNQFRISINKKKGKTEKEFSQHSQGIQFIKKEQEKNKKNLIKDAEKKIPETEETEEKMNFFIKSSTDYEYHEESYKLFPSQISNKKLVQYIEDKRAQIAYTQQKTASGSSIFIGSSISYCYDESKEEYFQRKLSHNDLVHYLEAKRNQIFVKQTKM